MELYAGRGDALDCVSLACAAVWNDDGENPSPFLYQAFSGSNTTYEQLLNVDPPQQDWPIYWLEYIGRGWWIVR